MGTGPVEEDDRSILLYSRLVEMEMVMGDWKYAGT